VRRRRISGVEPGFRGTGGSCRRPRKPGAPPGGKHARPRGRHQAPHPVRRQGVPRSV